jgi:hypothetical protein
MEEEPYEGTTPLCLTTLYEVNGKYYQTVHGDDDNPLASSIDKVLKPFSERGVTFVNVDLNDHYGLLLHMVGPFLGSALTGAVWGPEIGNKVSTR